MTGSFNLHVPSIWKQRKTSFVKTFPKTAFLTNGRSPMCSFMLLWFTDLHVEREFPLDLPWLFAFWGCFHWICHIFDSTQSILFHDFQTPTIAPPARASRRRLSSGGTIQFTWSKFGCAGSKIFWRVLSGGNFRWTWGSQPTTTNATV